MHGLTGNTWAAGLALCVFLGLAAGCHEEGDIRVASLSFDGNDVFDDARLTAVLATKASGWFPWSTKHYFDRGEFEADLDRLRAFYDAEGYPDADITAVDVAMNERGDAVKLRIELREGAPIIVERLDFTGFDVLSERIRASLESAPLTEGEPKSLEREQATKQRALDLLRNNGYAYATVDVHEGPGSTPHAVVIVMTATPGPATVFGTISIHGLARVTPDVVLRELSIEEGAVFRQRQVTDSQRRLATLQILQFASVTARAPEGAVVSRIPVELTVVENPPRVLQLGAGYGSEDRFRASAQWSHLNFLGQARQASAEAKWSSIDRGAKVSLSQPYWFRRGLAIEAEGASWWTHESTYDSRTFGGRIGVSYRFGERRPGRGRLVGNRVRAGYAREYLRYNIRPETLEDLTNVDELIALGLDPVSGRGRGVNAAIELTYDRNAADDLRDPRSGYGASVHVAHARPWLGGTFHYDEILADGRTYLPVARRIVVALRARVGTLAAGTDADVPFSARYFLGGSTSLRGWGRYQVAPLSNGVPIGGRTTFDSSVEARVQIRGPFGAVAFFDAGNVWPGTWDVDFHDLRSSVGIGLRYGTPIGLVRGDIASQVSRVPGLLIDGLPEERHWRLHLSLGQAF